MTNELRIDIPVARAIVAHHGREAGLRIIERLADEKDQEAALAAYEALDSKIERTDPENGVVVLESVFVIDHVINPDTGEVDYSRQTYWDGGGVVIFGRSLPSTVAIAATGLPIDAVVEHPLLTGLIISSIDEKPDDDGRPLIVIDVESPSCMLDDVAKHIGTK